MKPIFDSQGSPFAKVLKNFFILLSGRATAGLLFFASTILSARLLQPYDLGVIVMLHAYVMTIRGLVSVRPFEAIVKYGTLAADNAEYDRLGRLLLTSLKLDLITAFLGFWIAFFGLHVLIALGYVESSIKSIGLIYCLLILLANDGTAVGSLRIWNKFNRISYCLIGGALCRLLGIAILYFFNSVELLSVALVWFFSSSIQYALLQVTGWQMILKALPKPILMYQSSFKSCGIENKGFWKFLHVVYWQSSLDIVPKRGGILLSGLLLGTEVAALFRIANDLASVIAKPALLVRQVIFPDLARLKYDDTKNLPLTLKVSAFVTLPAGLLALVSFWLGEDFISLVVGDPYITASILLTFLIVSATLELASSPLRPFLYIADSAGLSLAIQVFGTSLYVLIFFLGFNSLHLLTPGVASITLNSSILLLTAGAIFFFRSSFERQII